MDRFGDLPPELVARIIELSATVADPSDPLEARRTRHHLDSLSRVHPSWTPIAQRLLLGRNAAVQLFHRRQYGPFAQLVLATPKSYLPRLVQSLTIELWGQTQDDELSAVIRACDGLDELVFTHIERVHLDQVACGQSLSALSLRQCSLVSTYYPLLSPPVPSSMPSPPTFTALTSLDLRLCSLRRDFLPFESYMHDRPLPNLQHLLLHTGSHDQSPVTVRALVRSVAAQLRSLSLDATAEAILFPGTGFHGAPLDDKSPPGAADAVTFPALRTLGLYWDAAYSRLVGLRFLLPAGPSAAPRPGPPARSLPPPYLHLALYPAGLDALQATLLSLFENTELRASLRWRAVEQLRAEGTLRDLDRAQAQSDSDTGPGEAEEEDEDEDEDEDGDSGEDSVRRRRQRRRAASRERPTDTLIRVARDAGVELVVEENRDSTTAASTPSFCAQPALSSRRATFARGFGTSWWRFVRQVERDDIPQAVSAPRQS